MHHGPVQPSSSLARLAFAALASLGAACQTSTPPPAGAPPATPASSQWSPPPGMGSVAGAAETYASPRAPRQIGSALLFLPGSSSQQMVNFATINGQAILEGDILLGPATTLPFRYGIPWQSSPDRKSAVAVADRSYLWPGGDIPYLVDASAQNKVAAIDWAVRAFEGTALRFRPRTASDRDYVVFRTLGEGCWSYLGRQGGPQDIDVTTCGGGNIAHELMHAAGFYHEQSRGDRDDYVSIVWDEIAPEMRSNFDKRDARGQDIGPYDYDSIMHYPSTAGSVSGRPTIVPRSANVQIGQRERLSALDRAAIEILYPASSRSPSAAPSPVAVPAPSAPAPTPVPATVSLPMPSLPVPAATTATTAQTSTAPPAPPPAPTPVPSSTGASPSFTGTYNSARGAVSCNQGGLFVQCTYPSGSLFCAANGPELACTWNGGGTGRATFQRQASGVLAGTWGDGFSTNSRGAWDLVPASGPAPASAAPSPRPAAGTPAAPVPAGSPAGAAASLSGNFQSTRGNMSCVESGAAVSCNFQEPDGTNGRLDCAKSQNGLELSCAWITFFPRPATGRAAFTRATPSERRLSGTWGTFLAASGGGVWNAQGL